MFSLVTWVPDPQKGESGNLYTATSLYVEMEEASSENGWNPKVAWYLEHPIWKKYYQELNQELDSLPMLMTPNFDVGEILILDSNDRDQFGRKPSKWEVTVEDFNTIEELLVRLEKLKEADIG
jgi:hypothetical protein